MLDDDERLRQAIRVGNIGIFDHDHRTDHIFWSLELRRMYGWDADEPVTLPKIISHVHPEDAEVVISAVRRAHDPAGDGAFDIEHRILDRSGRLRWIQTRSKTHFDLVSGEQRPVRTIGASQDVSERHVAAERMRVLEAELAHAQKMESVGRLAGGVAHDFNNLLTVISGGLQLGLAELPAGARSREYLDSAVEAAGSAAALTRQLLAFSRKEIIAPKALDLNEVLKRVEKMILRLLGEDIKLVTIRGEELPPVVFDPGQMEQIIVNLAVNARDAMPHGGRMTIQTSTVHVDEAFAVRKVDLQRGLHVVLSVSDNGTGLTPDARAHLFEPFFTTKGRGKGTGLGLAMVYGALQQNGGRIEVDSEPDQGTTFRIYLKAASDLTLSPPPQELAPPAARGGCVLLVEDDFRVRAFATNVLLRFGYEVHAFPNGEEALAAAASLRPVPELLLTDVVMPGMNGLVLAERIAKIIPGVRVLYVSGYTQDVIVNQGTLKEDIEFLAKPYSVDQLARRVGELLL